MNNQTVTPEVQKEQQTVNKVLDDAGRYFRDGLQAFKDNRRSEAGQNFDKSVEVFLYSTLNIKRYGKLSGCYNQLIETVYRVEFPKDAQQPKVRELSATCGWSWNTNDFKLADDVVALTRPKVSENDRLKNYVLPEKRSPEPNESPLFGFNQERFEPSPLDDLAKLRLTPEEEELDMPNHLTTPKQDVNIKVVKAVAGDTVAKLAQRNAADPTEVAKFNGLLPNSVLAAGREVKIPRPYIKYSQPPVSKPSPNPVAISSEYLGPKPVQMKDGKVTSVIAYLNENLNDPYSMRFVRWTPVTKAPLGNQYYWAVEVKYRAKNLVGAYVLTEQIYYVRNNQVVKVLSL